MSHEACERGPPCHQGTQGGRTLCSLTRVGEQRDILGERPLWDEREQAFFWVNIRRPALRRLDPATGAVETRPMPGLVGSIAPAQPGRLLIALAERVAVYDSATDRLDTVAEPPFRVEGHRFNAATARAGSGSAPCTI